MDNMLLSLVVSQTSTGSQTAEYGAGIGTGRPFLTVFQEARLEVMGVFGGGKLDSCFLLATIHMLPNWQGDCPASAFIIASPHSAWCIYRQQDKKRGKKCIQL